MFGFGKPARTIESRVQDLYEDFAAVAKRYRYAFRRPALTVGGRPTVVLLGNHSSGKSTIVNDLLGDPPVQATGVAPTDDAFTVLLYGAEEHDFFGPAALGQLPAEFQGLSALGPEFLTHLAVRFRDRDILRSMNLVDSPGMIDTPEGATQRSYDFTAAVRSFVEFSDLVLFLFDPGKPGTTGETVDVLSACLRGQEFKLRVLLNKADTFDSMEDFARAYGTLCWNLARVLRTKDLPPIHPTFTPSTEARLAARIPLDTFERHRAELLAQLRAAPQRRLDSVLAGATADFSRLSIQARVLGACRRRLFLDRLFQGGVFVVFEALAFFASWFFLFRWAQAEPSLLRTIVAWAGTILATGGAAVLLALGAYLRQRCVRNRLVANLDTVFRNEFAELLAVGNHGSHEQHWADVKPDVSSILSAKLSVPLFSWGEFRRLERVLDTDLPAISASARGPVQQ